MTDLRSRLTQITTSAWVCPERKDTWPFEVTREWINTQINQGIEPSHIASKHYQFGFVKLFLQEWIDKLNTESIMLYWWVPVLKIQGKFITNIPVQDNLSLRDNLYILLRSLDAYYSGAFISCFEQSEYSSDMVIYSIIEPSLAAISTGIAYHYLIFETMTEWLTVDLDEIDKEVLDKRVKSWYWVLSKISSLFENIVLVILDDISTVNKTTPFYLDSETDEISIKDEVLEILEVAASLYSSLRDKKSEVSQLFMELNEKVYWYTCDHEVFQSIMETITNWIEIGSNELHWCPAHWVKSDNRSLFKHLYEVSIKSFTIHYSYLRKNKSTTQWFTNKINQNNEEEIYSPSTRKWLNYIHTAGRGIMDM